MHKNICRALVHELKHSKAQLQAQVKGMVAAEHSLTEHLKGMHLQIDEQLQQLREQLKVGRSMLLISTETKV